MTSSAKCSAKPRSKISRGQRCLSMGLRKSRLHLTVILRRAWALTQRLPRRKFPAELRPRALRRPSRIWKDVSIKKPSKQEPNHECKPGYEDRKSVGRERVESTREAAQW